MYIHSVMHSVNCYYPQTNFILSSVKCIATNCHGNSWLQDLNPILFHHICTAPAYIY